MLQQIDKTWWHKLNAASRLGLVRGLSLPNQKYLLVNEFPKSGGSWMAQMLAEVTNLPFPRNRLPSLTSSILHGHYRAKHVKQPCAIVWRDGRDVLVSLYYHRLIGNNLTSSSQTMNAREKLGVSDVNDIAKYLPRFIEMVAKGDTHPRYCWSTFVQEWVNSPKMNCAVKYEDMLQDAGGCLKQVADSFGYEIADGTAAKIAAHYSFQKQSGRSAGEENTQSYLRKGVAGDWKSKFSIEARQVFDHYMGNALIALEYEDNHDWVG